MLLNYEAFHQHVVHIHFDVFLDLVFENPID